MFQACTATFTVPRRDRDPDAEPEFDHAGVLKHEGVPRKPSVQQMGDTKFVGAIGFLEWKCILDPRHRSILVQLVHPPTRVTIEEQ